MAELKDNRVPILLTDSDLKRLDDWRRAAEDMPSRGEAIRRLLDLGFEYSARTPKLSEAADRKRGS